jgi:uncharacterized protein YbcI
MASLSGDISDGVILHGFSTKKYIQKVLLPEIIIGKKYNNLKNDFMITTGGFLIVSNEDKKIQKKIEQVRSQIAFYASTKSYRKVMEIHNWEYGSYWISLTLGSLLAVQILGSVTWSSAYISTQINKQKEQELYLRQMEARTEMIEEIQETQKKYLNQLIDNEVKHISKEHFDNEDNQRDKKLKNTIKLFTEIILRGGEFQPSLISPKEIQESYPDFNLIEAIESKVKQLAQVSSTKEQ